MFKDEPNTNNLDNRLTDRNLTVKIIGLNIFHLNQKDEDNADGDNQWKLFFPVAFGHTFKIEIKRFVGRSEDRKYDFILPPKSVIDFFPTSKTIGIGEADSSLDSIINFGTLHYGFRKNIKLSLNPPQRGEPQDSIFNNYAGFLNLNGTKLYAEDIKKTKYEVWRVERNTKNKIPKDFSLGHILSAGFKVEKDSTRIVVRKGLDFNLDLSYAEIEGKSVSYEVTFYNDCQCDGTCANVADMKYYYKIIDEILT